jgi:hypothetical protein
MVVKKNKLAGGNHLMSTRLERVTWRLDPSNYEFVNSERLRMRLTSMSAALNVILAEHREKCCHRDSTVTAKRQHSDSTVTAK